MVGYVSGWMGRWMDRWTNRWVSGFAGGWMDGWMAGEWADIMFLTRGQQTTPASLHTLSAPECLARKESSRLFIKQLRRWVKFSLQQTSLKGAGELPLKVFRALPWEKASTPPPEPVTLAMVPGLLGKWEGGRWCLEAKPNARTRLLSCCVPDKWYTGNLVFLLSYIFSSKICL